MNIKELLNKSQLFPGNIKKFLLEALESDQLNDEVVSELKAMLMEEIEAIDKIDKETEDALAKL